MGRHIWIETHHKVRGRGKPGGWIDRAIWTCKRCQIRVGGVDPRKTPGKIENCDLMVVLRIMEV